MDKWEQGWDAVRGRVGLTDWDFSRRKEKPRPEFLALPRASFFRAAILPLSLLHSVDAPPLTSGFLQFKDLCRTTIPQSTWCTVIEVKRIHYVVNLPEIKARFGAILSAERRIFAKKSFQIQHLSMFSFNWLFMESFLVRKKQTGISCLAFYSWTLCTNRQRATIWAE